MFPYNFKFTSLANILKFQNKFREIFSLSASLVGTWKGVGGTKMDY